MADVSSAASSSSHYSKRDNPQEEEQKKLAQEQQKLAKKAEQVKPLLDWKFKCIQEEYTHHEFHGTRLHMFLNGQIDDVPNSKIEGKSKSSSSEEQQGLVDEIVPNMLRHIIMSRIVTYANGSGTITIKENTGCIDEHCLSARFCNLPIPVQAPTVMVLDQEYFPYIKGDKGTMAPDREYPRHPEDKADICLSLNVRNEAEEMRNVTTNDLKCLVRDQEVSLFDKKYPILLVKLRMGESISCQMLPTLGFGDLHTGWSPVSNAYVKGSPGKTELILHSKHGQQMTEKELLIRACKLMQIKMHYYIMGMFSLVKNYDKVTHINLDLKGEGKETGEFLTYLMHFRRDVFTYADYIHRHPHLQEITLNAAVHKGKNPAEALMGIFATARDMYLDIEKQVSKFSEKPKYETVDLDYVLRPASPDIEDEDDVIYESSDDEEEEGKDNDSSSQQEGGDSSEFSSSEESD
jgi:hypothetical protein